MPRAKRGKKASRSLLFKGAKSRLLLPATSTKNAMANIQAAGGGWVTDDHLTKVKPGERTILNANKYRFADFFYRVKDAIRRHWSPAAIYRQRDPTGRVYGVKDRHTVVRITLSPSGKLTKVLLRRRSGLSFLDAEAKRAVRASQPFSNPPRELVKKGKISFDFGFYFAISTGRHRFRWRRL
jgi:TonB family protein